MLELFIIGYCLYFIVTLYTSFVQINYVKEAKKKVPVILEEGKYEEAASYSMEKEKIAMVSHVYEFAIFFMWIFLTISILYIFLFGLFTTSSLMSGNSFKWLQTLPISRNDLKKLGFMTLLRNLIAPIIVMTFAFPLRTPLHVLTALDLWLSLR